MIDLWGLSRPPYFLYDGKFGPREYDVTRYFPVGTDFEDRWPETGDFALAIEYIFLRNKHFIGKLGPRH